MKLHLGVLDIPYADAASYKQVRRKKPKTISTGSVTTGDVATILESKYGLMQTFYDMYAKKIATSLEKSFKDAIEAVMQGAPAGIDPYGAATSEIEDMFRQALAKREFDNLIPGVPTEASKEGHSKRFKKPYKKRDPRPSFIDTGLFEGSMRAWIDEE